jgi:hypothetical protein
MNGGTTMKTTKGKIITIVACAVLVLSLGTMTAFAASSGGGPSLFKMQDGQPSYSTDEGKTWIDGAPDGFNTETDVDGKTFAWFGEKPGDDADSFSMEAEDSNSANAIGGGSKWNDDVISSNAKSADNR